MTDDAFVDTYHRVLGFAVNQMEIAAHRLPE